MNKGGSVGSLTRESNRLNRLNEDRGSPAALSEFLAAARRTSRIVTGESTRTVRVPERLWARIIFVVWPLSVLLPR